MPDKHKAPILIVGAGPTGLVLALELARRGIGFRIIDKNSGPGQASRALAVHARTLEFYRQLGFAGEVVDKGIKVEVGHLREGGEEVALLQFRNIGEGLSPYPYLLIFPQDDHERFLVGKLREAGIEVEWDVELQSFTQDSEGVHAFLHHKGREEKCDFDYLCGCDGLHGKTREILQIGFPGGTYNHLYYVADVNLREPRGKDIYFCLGADTFALMMPVRSSGTERLIGIASEVADNGKQLTFEDVRPAAESFLGIRVEAVNWFSTYRVHHRVADHFAVGRCFLAGDAGHVHSPAGAQGMNTGIGDAVNLAWKLASVVQGKADATLLETYEQERIGFARELVSTTDRVFQAVVSAGIKGKLVRQWVMPHLIPFLLGFAPMRRLMFRTISQIRINYEGSPLSDGKHGEVRGGHRLPWVTDGTSSNFDALQSLDWQVHVYGQVKPGLADRARMLHLPVHTFNWSEAAEKAGLERDAMYVVRPDGYVAIASRGQDLDVLDKLVKRFHLRFSL